MAQSQSIPVTARVADFAVGTSLADIPAHVVAQAKVAIADSVGTLLGGLNQPSVKLLREYTRGDVQAGQASVLGTDVHLQASGAAFINAATAHVLDFDNISYIISGFVTTPIFFALLALAEERNFSGRQLLEAFIVGYEVESSIGRGLGVAHYDGGWHSTSTMGHLGAAAGCAKLLGLDRIGTRRALGFAATDASGVRSMVGNMTNIYHLGKAARSGVMAAALVERGFTAHESVIENDWGFCTAFNGPGNFDLDAMVTNIGKPYDLVDPGLGIKLYPCCALIHSGIDGLVDLVRTHGIKASNVKKARLALHDLAYKTMTMRLPIDATAYESKFDIPFITAIALTYGCVKLEHFSEAHIRDPKIREIMQRVEVTVPPELVGYDSFLLREYTDVALDLDNGKTVGQRVMRMANRGSRDRPATPEELREKFSDCAREYPNCDGAMRVYEMVGRLEELGSLRELTECLR